MTTAAAGAPQAAVQRGAGSNLALATAAFALTFWAWNLIGPLSKTYADRLDLDPTQVSVLVAFPVLVGAVGRIPAGILTDKLGGRVMLTASCFIAIVPVLLVGLSGDSYPALLVSGFLLGVAGTSFAVGIPFVNGWYPPAKRGFATGIFGAGMGGTALSAFFTPRLVAWLGLLATHLVMCAALAVMGFVVWAFARNAPQWRASTEPALPRLKAVMKLKVTWQMSLLYAIAFGGFVAFSTYLPTMLVAEYGLAQTDAGLRTAGFSLAAVIARPAGGILSDKVGPLKVCLTSFFGAAAMAVVLALEPPLEVPAGTSFVLMALFLGLGTGGVFALVAELVDPARVGGVTGIVGAAGGLGGYFPPLIMGANYQANGDYTIGLLLLAATALLVGLFTVKAFRNVPRPGGPAAPEPADPVSRLLLANERGRAGIRLKTEEPARCAT
ncbi:nitrate/nitrite transporter [Glycomyces algeriensis]|uniref:MFS transporter n=1 Tax=Glycomyces algeriensis TaxID=256037 RepID=A0A9W6G6U9_9ACTN|nr:MFS transporter [Glycomyces algeriensis]MDA1368135.1 MFS transporter [Glycomyces algeriensis]MDR7348882.1 NNP family nitrate/nitrite transporter-like MFS transporter [Glycomyces algeriensis]GLI41586.1 MFS transporter [Glycomyces algeriensis]